MLSSVLTSKYFTALVDKVKKENPDSTKGIGRLVVDQLKQVKKGLKPYQSALNGALDNYFLYAAHSDSPTPLRAFANSLPLSVLADGLPQDFTNFLDALCGLRLDAEFKEAVANKLAPKSYREETGVDKADVYQNHGIELARQTMRNIQDGFEILTVPGTESYSAVRDKKSSRVIATVNEGLGTKNAAADRVLESLPELGDDWYRAMAQDNAAMVINDLLTSGILPAMFNVHVDIGKEDGQGFIADSRKGLNFNEGTKFAMDEAECLLAGGETAMLKGLVSDNKSILSGSVVGVGDKIIEQKIQDGDRIVLIGSSGIHANGITKVRELAETLPDKYQTDLGDGKTLAEALLTPTTIYVKLMKKLLEDKVDLHYVSNITGHPYDGKIMRAKMAADYILDGELPEPQPIFKFIQQHSGLSDEQMYLDYNMGAGFALYVPAAEVGKIKAIAKSLDLAAYDAGRVELKPAGTDTKRVIIPQSKGLQKTQNIVFEKTLAA